jgi:hypothetical protein
MEKSKEWDAMDTQDNELVAALELELYAGDCGVVEALQLSEIESNRVEERAVHVAAAAEGAIEVVDGDSENSSVSSDTDSYIVEG